MFIYINFFSFSLYIYIKKKTWTHTSNSRHVIKVLDFYQLFVCSSVNLHKVCSRLIYELWSWIFFMNGLVVDIYIESLDMSLMGDDLIGIYSWWICEHWNFVRNNCWVCLSMFDLGGRKFEYPFDLIVDTHSSCL